MKEFTYNTICSTLQSVSVACFVQNISQLFKLFSGLGLGFNMITTAMNNPFPNPQYRSGQLQFKAWTLSIAWSINVLFFVFKQMRISDRDSIDCKHRIISFVITDDSAQKKSGTALYTRCTAHDNPVSVVLRLGLTTSSLTSLSRVCIILTMLIWRGSSNAGNITML